MPDLLEVTDDLRPKDNKGDTAFPLVKDGDNRFALRLIILEKSVEHP